MSIISQKYIILCLIFRLLVEINCQMTQFKPMQRDLHTATLINNKLYILGGLDFRVNSNVITGKDFFYLDVSSPFNTQKLSWQDLSSINTVPAHSGAASVKSGADNNTLSLYADTTYTFNPQNNMWSIPTIAGINPTRKRNLMGVIDDKGKMNIWGGRVVTGKQVDTNDMLILDTLNFNWGKGSIVGAPTPRIDYGAIFLPDNNIIYIGGHDLKNIVEVSLNQVYIYHTISDSWNTKTTSGMVPSARSAFSAVLGLDGQKAIIFGGITNIPFNVKPIDTADSLYALYLINFEWYIPKTSGQIPKSRIYHTANVIGKYMVVSFGDDYLQSTDSDILLLDINDEFKWTNTFEPSPSAANSQHSQLPVVIAAIVGSSIGGILLAVICFFLYRRNRHKQRQKKSISIPGSERKYYNHKNLVILTTRRNTYNQGREQEILQIPEVPIYNHGREEIPIANNEKLSLQNIDDDVLQHLKNEMIQTLKQEIIQNLRQEVIQNLRQEIIQSLRQEILQSNGQVSSSNITKK